MADFVQAGLRAGPMYAEDFGVLVSVLIFEIQSPGTVVTWA